MTSVICWKSFVQHSWIITMLQIHFTWKMRTEFGFVCLWKLFPAAAWRAGVLGMGRRLLRGWSLSPALVSFWRGVLTWAAEFLLNQMQVSWTTTGPLISTLIASEKQRPAAEVRVRQRDLDTISGFRAAAVLGPALGLTSLHLSPHCSSALEWRSSCWLKMHTPFKKQFSPLQCSLAGVISEMWRERPKVRNSFSR